MNGENPEDDFAPQVSAYYKKCMNLLKTLYLEGMHQGFIGKDLDAEAMALETLCFIEGHIYMCILAERMPLERVLLPLFNAFIPGYADSRG